MVAVFGPVTIPLIILTHLLAQFGQSRVETERSGIGATILLRLLLVPSPFSFWR